MGSRPFRLLLRLADGKGAAAANQNCALRASSHLMIAVSMVTSQLMATQILLTSQEWEGAILQLHDDAIQHRQHGRDVQQDQDDGLGTQAGQPPPSHQRGALQLLTCSFPNTSPLAML